MNTIRLLFILFVFFTQFFVYADDQEGTCVKQNFLVSAYYSPLKNQKLYIRGDYQKDVVLNGNGTNGADGTDVYMGLLAAPKGYSFGTKVILPGLGVGTVHDRGGAIISGANYDRIDVWMGSGDEGLARALNWGMRFIEGEKCSSSVALKDTLDYTKISSTLPDIVERRLIARMKQDYSDYAQGSVVIKKKEDFKFVSIKSGLKQGDTGKDVVKLQMVLHNLGFYRDDILTGIYDIETMEAVYQFQRENDVISGDKDVGVGFFDDKTKKALDQFLVKLYSKIRYVNSTKTGEFLLGKKENMLSSIPKKSSKNKNLPMVKTDILLIDKNLSVNKIQEILLSKRINNLTNGTQIADTNKGGDSKINSIP